ncbi:MAG: prolipoprotein diacylglyceryl transferase [Gemmatimonadota bacterium]|nr:prolipoprotein diacylglyceryl transferase [Gemmatimonadota bacterium]MDH5759568.1 prolipoprotein diacylglyceryl transferase [Gemmatimonadota bacterium]
MYPILFRLPSWLPFIGGEPVTSFGVFMLLSFLTAGYITRLELERKGMDGERAWDFVFMAVLGGIGGAKLYYILLNFPLLVENPAALIFSRGGLVWYGGFLGAAVLVIWEMKRRAMPILASMDATAPALALAYAVGRVGCFLVGDDWGRPTSSWVGVAFPMGAPPSRVDIIEREFGITVDPDLIERFGQVVPVHPTQLYEVGLSTLIFFLLWRLRDTPRPAGWMFFLWLACAGCERFLVEFLRAKDDRFFGLITLAQFISLGLVAVAGMGMLKVRASSATAGSVS